MRVRANPTESALRQPSVLVGAGDQRIAYLIAADLSRRGVRVEVAGSVARTLWRMSRSVTRFHVTPSLRDPSEYVEAVIRICRQRAITAFFPSCGEVTALAPFHDRLAAHTSYPFAGEPLIALLNNKDWLTTKAAKLGIPVPQSVTVESGTNPEIPRDMKFPLVCKPAGSLGAKGFTIVTNQSQLRSAVAMAPPGDLELWLVQELVPGPLYVWNGIYWNGCVRAACVFEALKPLLRLAGHRYYAGPYAFLSWTKLPAVSCAASAIKGFAFWISSGTSAPADFY